MIAIQGFKNTRDSIFLVFDSNGIDEFISYLQFIKTQDSSMHLNAGNELTDDEDIEDDMFYIPHVKLINLDNIREPKKEA